MQEGTSETSSLADQSSCEVEEGEDGSADMVLKKGGDGGVGR